MVATQSNGWIRSGRRRGCAQIAFVVSASMVVWGQDVRQPEDGAEKKKVEEKIQQYQKAFEVQTRIGGYPWKVKDYYYYYRGKDSFRIGASLHTVDDALRAHLELPPGQGVIVVKVAKNSAAERAGIKRHDVLLTVDDKPLAKGEDLNKALKTAKGKGVTVKLVREGKEVSVTVQPDAGAAAWTYEVGNYVTQGHRIGVEVAVVDDALVSQLRLSEGKGIIVTKVLPESPAQKAGIKVYDILLEAGLVGDKRRPLASVKDLRSQVSAAAGKQLVIALLRRGEEREITVASTGFPNQVVWNSAVNSGGNPDLNKIYGIQYPGVASVNFSPDGKVIATGSQDGTVRLWDATTGKALGTDVGKELSQVLSQLEELRKTVERLRDRVKQGK